MPWAIAPTHPVLILIAFIYAGRGTIAAETHGDLPVVWRNTVDLGPWRPRPRDVGPWQWRPRPRLMTWMAWMQLAACLACQAAHIIAHAVIYLICLINNINIKYRYTYNKLLYVYLYLIFTYTFRCIVFPGSFWRHKNYISTIGELFPKYITSSYILTFHLFTTCFII